MSKPIESAAKFSSELLNEIMDHAHLTGSDYTMALQRVEARDSAVTRAAKLEQLDELLALEDGTTDPAIRARDAIRDNAVRLALLDEVTVALGLDEERSAFSVLETYDVIDSLDELRAKYGATSPVDAKPKP